MNFFSGGLIAVAAICVAMGLLQLVIATRVEGRRTRLLFAIAAFAVAADAVVEIRLFQSREVAQFKSLMPITAIWICVALIALAWFIELRTHATRRWLLIVESGLLAATAILDNVLPTGIAYLRIDGLRELVLPWGETVSFAVGSPNPWRIVGDAANIGFLVLLLDATVRLIRRGQRREAWLIGGSFVTLSLGVLVIIPNDLGMSQIPAVHPFAFLVIVAAMSWDLSATVAREARLSHEIIAGERRWQQLLQNVQMLVVSLNRDGKIVSMNPFAEELLGWPGDEVAGRDFLEFIPDDDRSGARAAFERGLAGNPDAGTERVLLTRDGRSRIVRWRTVALRDKDGSIEGLLSVGADVTELRQSAEQTRRTAAELERTVAELEELKLQLEEENLQLKEEIASVHGFEEIVGGSDALLYVLHKVKKVAPTDATVLIRGETGVGKELIARAIHRESDRAGRPFIAVNCAALPSSLVESELFGHERGAFTGADRQRKGRFELADGGTLLLDEVGDLPVEVQAKLLRVLQDGELQRVGGSATIRVDVRVLAATNRDLQQDVAGGRFREDLFYRLEVYPITIPPLRDRSEDIEPLVHHFARRIAAKRGVQINEMPAGLMRTLRTYSWPGNVRELQNVIERAVLTSRDGVLKLAAPLEAKGGEPASTSVPAPAETTPLTLEEVERRHIVGVLDRTGGKISGTGGAAEVLGLHANTLRYRMQKLGISTKRGTHSRA